MADKRPYTKKNTDYWNNRHNRPASAPAADTTPFPAVPFPEINYGSTETATASGPGQAPQTLTRGAQLNSVLSDAGAFQNLEAMPGIYGDGYNGTRDGGYVGNSRAVNLCVKAYAGVPVVRNAVEVAVEFSSQPLYVKSSNDTVLTFFTEWLKAVQMEATIEQYFRAYYREGAAFFMRFDGMFGPSYYQHFQRAFAAKENRVPIRYDLINPATISATNNLAYPFTYVRLMSPWEAERLRNPLNEQDKQVLKDLPPEAREQILNGSNTMGIYMPLDPKRLRFSFYKKQGYEAFGIPFIWPILPSIEWKLTLTKMDKMLARTIEHAILLVTMGEPPSKENGGNGINPNNIARVQALLNNPTLGRALVADYTVKAQWLVPPIQEILGPEKYQVVNEDIREGLQSILTGDDKFANAQIKAQIFIQRLKEGQNRFLNDFLLPEVQTICRTMGFRSVPEIGFTPINLQDETVYARIITQLGQLGILTAEQVIQGIQTKVLPDADEMKRGQQAYLKDRDKGLYNPLIGGQKDEEAAGPNGRPAGSGVKQSGTRKSSPIGTSKASTTDAFSLKSYTARLKEATALENAVAAALKKRYKIKGDLNEAQANVAKTLVKVIVATQPVGEWEKAVASAIKEPPAIPADIADEIDGICAQYETDPFDAAILRHCRTEAPLAA